MGDWLRRIAKEGLDRRYNRKQTGRPSYLTKKQKEELKQALSETPEKHNLPFRIWTTKIVAYFLEQKYNVSYKIRKIEKLVHELGFNFKKARPEHRLANKKLQEVFKKTSSSKLAHMLRPDGRSYFLTRASSK